MSSLESFVTAFSSFSNVYNQPFGEFVNGLDMQGRQQLRSQAFKQPWKFIPRSKNLKGKIGNAEDPGDGIVYDTEIVTKARSTLEHLYQAWRDRDRSSAASLETAVSARSHTRQ